MSYRIVVTCPVELAAVASSVGRAMDVDVGGADSFVPVYDAYDSQGKPVGQPASLQAQTWASAAFATMFQYLLASPAGLHMAVAADYATRWPSLTPPRAEDIQRFCEATRMSIDPALPPQYL